MRAVLPLFFCMSVIGCRAKANACNKAVEGLDSITKDLAAAAAAAPSVATPGAPEACAKLADEARRVESAQAKRSVLGVANEGLQKRVNSYREHVDGWATSSRAAQVGCVERNGNAMLKALGESVHHHAQLAYAIAEINSYCRAP